MHGKVAFLGVGDASYYSRLFMYLLFFFFFSVYDVDFIAGLLQFAVHYYNKALEFPLHEASKSDGSNRGKVWLVNAKGCFQLPIFNFQFSTVQFCNFQFFHSSFFNSVFRKARSPQRNSI